METGNSENRVLLPANVVPKNYKIWLKPDLTAFTFHGTVSIELEVVRETDRIVVHAAELKVRSASVTYTSAGGGGRLEASGWTEEPDGNDMLTLSFGQPLPLGAGATLTMAFDGILNDNMAGFYRSKYSTLDGEQRYAATTQFQPTDARRCFPCFDEPALKATFEISLTLPDHLVALSNMPVALEMPAAAEPGLKTVVFERSLPMSTYLVAFVLGEFDCIEGRTSEGVVVRVYTPLGKKEQGEFALSVATRTLSYFSSYFDIAYPLPKLDMVAIPDFAAGAMENWGLVTYRETALLVDPLQSGVQGRQRVAEVVAHELAHQWFGNLVTMQWWDNLWLNEGFASYIGNQAVAALFPEWDMWLDFVNQYFSSALELDSLDNSHAIEIEVKHSNEINEIFDAISYDKGASVIRMIAQQIGPEAFRRGLHIYLKRFEYGNTVTADLWRALSEAADGFDVALFADKWTKTAGYPLVSVELGADDAADLAVSQSRFFVSGHVQQQQPAADAAAADAEQQLWPLYLPVRVAGSEAVTVQPLLGRSGRVPVCGGGGWVKLNAECVALVRVKYDSRLTQRLGAALAAGELQSPVDRLELLNDAFALAKAGFVPTVDALALADGMRGETNYTVWSNLAGNLAALCSVWSDEPAYPQLQALGRELFGPIGTRLGWQAAADESQLDTLLRTTVLGMLSLFDAPAVIAECRRRFAAYRADAQAAPIPPDLRGVVYACVVKNGGAAEWDELLGMYRTATLQEEKLRALRALGASRQPALLRATLELAVSPEVRAQDIATAFYPVAANPVGRNLAWAFFQERFETIQEILKDAGLLMPRLISILTDNFSTQAKLQEVEAFFASHPVPAAERTIKQSCELIRANTRWRDSNVSSVQAWLNANYPL
eukprot:TRINITY_DN4120_c0_g1_i1.p1 TRINITY_DN4120_c0_g1~~TRINITY_DN4120_c0_g1_i1.p1  ORF type:complete len:889 (-),score=315.99 TRINITY_DN4120_c0_g1_i1:342-3008(-)